MTNNNKGELDQQMSIITNNIYKMLEQAEIITHNNDLLFIPKEFKNKVYMAFFDLGAKTLNLANKFNDVDK